MMRAMSPELADQQQAAATPAPGPDHLTDPTPQRRSRRTQVRRASVEGLASVRGAIRPHPMRQMNEAVNNYRKSINEIAQQDRKNNQK